MSSIKIIAMPPGQAPEAVRREWVGLIIPMPEQETGGLQMGVLGGKSQQQGGYQVETETALDLLHKKCPEAAEWFWDNGFLGGRLVFARDVCEVLSN